MIGRPSDRDSVSQNGKPVQVGIPSRSDLEVFQAVAIDFETANASRSSPCAIGLAWVGLNGVSHVSHRLIRPKSLKFDGINISIHGIRPEDVKDEPEFPEVWAELAPHLTGTMVLAHNASFDMSVLRATLDLYGLMWPELSYLCTVKVARECWPELVDHKLPTVAAHLGIDLDHHVASSDAEACAQVALRAAARVNNDINGVADAFGMTVGMIRPSWYQPCSAPPKPSFAAARTIAIGDEALLAGKSFVFTGTLQAMTRNEAGHLVQMAGGNWHNNVRKDTDYLMVGMAPGGDKLAKAAVRMDRYGRPELIDEAEFLSFFAVDSNSPIALVAEFSNRRCDSPPMVLSLSSLPALIASIKSTSDPSDLLKRVHNLRDSHALMNS
jgi:DNA polymerase-3 subunit epsilon